MSEPEVEARPAVTPGHLLRELHGFLSLEAPYLIPALPASGTDEEVEAALHAAVRDSHRAREDDT